MVNQPVKENFYYIDEAGSLESDSKFFILGCYKTDTPEDVRKEINSLREELIDSPYYAFERKKFLKQGLHACENHFDIRARFYNLIATLNIRAYILLLNKNSEYFRYLTKDNDGKNIYKICIEKLLKDRLIKTRNYKNTLVFEEYGSKVIEWQKNINIIIEKIKANIKTSFGTDLSYNINVHSKADANLSIIDYLNFLFVQFYEHKKTTPRMLENFRIIEPKMALIYKMDKDIFYDKNNRIDPQTY